MTQINDGSGDESASTAQVAKNFANQEREDAGLTASTKEMGADEGLTEINREFQETATLRKAKDLKMPYIDLSKTPLNPDFLKIASIEETQSARAIPFFKVGKKLRIAVEEPNNPNLVNLIERLESAGFDVDLSLASQKSINEVLDLYSSTQKYKEKEIVKTIEQKSVETFEKEIEGLKDLPEKIRDMTAEEGLNLINIAAVKTGASDIHYEPSEGIVEVRFRIDGMLHKVFDLNVDVYEKIANQIKYAGKMQLNVYTIPQDGRYTFSVNEEKIGVRVSSIPTPFGESFVCRFLVGGAKIMDFSDLGFQGIALKKIQSCVNISQGMVLVTGPTGSGKSTTLYTVLSKMNSPENKVITLEDPVEYPIKGVTQSQIDEKKGYTFSNGLRAILRQDPDVVMIGEIRDIKTAETSAQAALTGHVVLSTLHTNSAIETIPRLINMGLPAFMVAPALNTILAQRLVRKVCLNCSTMVEISESSRREFERIFDNLKQVNPGAVVEIPEKIPEVHGCDQCSHTGYKGRFVLAEVVYINAELKDLVLKNASLVDMIAAVRKSGMITMREDGFLKVAQGITTLEEVYRVTNVAGGDILDS